MNVGGWALIKDIGTGDLHVTPINDITEHELGMDCWCNPARDEEHTEIVVHNALDQREAVERGERRVQ